MHALRSHGAKELRVPLENILFRNRDIIYIMGLGMTLLRSGWLPPGQSVREQPGENCQLAYVALHVVRKFYPQGAGLPE